MLDSWYGNEKIMNTYRGKRVFGTYSGFWAIDSLASNERLDFQLLTCIEIHLNGNTVTRKLSISASCTGTCGEGAWGDLVVEVL